MMKKINNCKGVKDKNFVLRWLLRIVIFTNIIGGSILYGQTTITIGSGTSYQTIAPINNYNYYSASEMIFLKDELNLCAGGSISKIRFYTEATGSTILDNLTLYLKHTTENTLSSGTSSLSGYTQVYSGSLPNSSTGWNELSFNTNFDYNGTDNIELLVVKNKNSDNSWSSSTSYRYTTGTSYRTRRWSSDVGLWDNTVTLAAIYERPNIQFDITVSACSGTPNIGNAISSGSYTCEGENFTLSLSECVGLNGLTLQWQQSSDNNSWSHISGQTAAVCIRTQGTESEMYYRCMATCANSGLSSYSTAIKITKLSSCPTIKVGSGQTYTSLTANTAQGLFKYINTNGLTSNTTVVITSDLSENGAVALNQWSTGSQYSLIITSNDAVLHTISNSGDNNLINFNGSDKVLIDGSENAMGGGQYLKFVNSSTTKASIQFTNSAKRDTIKNCIVTGQSSNGVICFYSNGATQYNDSSAVINCDISSMNTTPTNKLVYLYGTTSGGHNNYNSISNCTIGHFCGGSTESDHGAIYCGWYSNYNTFSKNIIYNDYILSSNCMNGICVIKGTGNIIDGNAIGGNMKDGSGTWEADVVFFSAITFNNSSGSIIIRNDTIRNISTKNLGSNNAGSIWGIMEKADVQSTDSMVIRSNVIYNLQTTQIGSQSEGAITGIMASNGQNKTVEKNIIYNLKALNTGNVNSNYVMGVLLRSPGKNFFARQNRVYDLGNLSTHSDSRVCAITSGLNYDATDFTNPPIVSHNMVSLINSTDVAQHNGIFTNTTTSLYNNSVYIGGTAPTSSRGSNGVNFNEAIAAGNTISDLVRNNILINAKTGVGNNVAILKTNNFTTAPVSCNYNLLVSTDNAVLCRANGNNYSFTGWKALQSLLDANSWSVKVTSGSSNATEINPSNLFTDLSTANLYINNSHQDCWFANGKGVAISTVSSDFDGDAVGNMYGFGTDIGADEFDPGAGVEPHTLTSSTNPFDFTFAGRHLATVNFSAGTPSSLSIQYYTGEGVIAPDPVGAEFFDSYMHVWPSDGSGYKYDITIDYDEALLGGLVEIGDENEEIMARQDNATLIWAHYNDDAVAPNPISSRNTVANTLTCSNLTVFSNFTGTKKTNPLPISLMNFDAKIHQFNDVKIDWETTIEINNNFFEVQRSINGVDFISINRIPGAGNSNNVVTYSNIDKDAFSVSSVLFYRLKQTDYDGKYSYSETVYVLKSDQKEELVSVCPNPSETNLITFNATSPELYNLTILTLSGQVIQIQELTSSQISLPELTKGMYILQFNNRISGEIQNVKYVQK